MDATLRQAGKILEVFEGTPREQIQALLASGLLADLRDANFGDPIDRDAVRRLLGIQPINPTLFEELGTVIIPAITELFVARNKFVVGNAGISWLGDQFETWFIGKTEKPAAETTLRYAKLTRASLDGPILTEFGDKAETTLAQIFVLVELQKNGEAGVLLTNGWVNIFYVRDISGKLWAMYVLRYVDGWFMDADSVTSPHGWDVVDRVFSRDS